MALEEGGAWVHREMLIVSIAQSDGLISDMEYPVTGNAYPLQALSKS